MSYWLHWYNIKHETNRRAEKLLVWFVWKLPRRIAYWSAIRVISHATVGKYSQQDMADLTATDALQRWYDKP
jgi:hypothetical protein